MNVPNDNVITFPGPAQDGLRGQMLTLANASRTAQEALAQSRRMIDALSASAEEGRQLAAQADASAPCAEIHHRAEACRSLCRQLAAI